MIIVYNPETYRLHEKQIISFERLYESNFPDINEREDFQFIKTRIVNPSFMENAKSFLILEEASGLVVEYYASASSLFLTYIVIEPQARNKGMARKLVYEGISQVKDIVNEYSGKTVEAVFFEVNDPTATKIDSFDPWLRLEVFRKMSAKYINLTYVQPSLGEGKSRVNNLFLCCFPDVVNGKNYLTTATITEFLAALYKDLGIGNPDLDPDFLKMKQELGAIDRQGRHFVSEIPRGEKSLMKFDKVAVALHVPFADDEEVAGVNCPFFASFEKDLLSYRFQKSLPFRSACLTPFAPLHLSLGFPSQFRYTSEGRNETVLVKRTEVPLNAYGLITRFTGSQYGICTIVLQPRDYFTEDDLIKLCSLFGSKQEESSLGDQLLVEHSAQKVKLKPFIEEFFERFGAKNIDFSVLTGSVNIDVKYTELSNGGGFDWLSFLAKIHGLRSGGDATIENLQKTFAGNQIERHIASALCGVAQGIFDYSRMGFEEFADTVSPVNSTPGSFSLVSRGNLLGIAYDDPLLAASHQTIGISPYLILPNIVLSYNEVLLSRSLAVFQKHGKMSGTKIKSIEAMLNESQAIASGVLPQVFQYRSEKNLVERGNEERNLNEMTEELHHKKGESESELERLYNHRKGKFDLYITTLLTIISIFQIEGLIRNTVQYVVGGERTISRIEIVESVVVFAVVVTVSLVIFTMGKRAFFKGKT